MTRAEEQLAASVEELKKLAPKTTDPAALAALNILINGFEAMRPYVRVGLSVSPSDEILDAINLLHSHGTLNQEQRGTIMKTLRLPRERTNSEALQQPAQKARGCMSAIRGPRRSNTVRTVRLSLASRIRLK